MPETQNKPNAEAVINSIINQTVTAAIRELKRENMVNEGRTLYQKTEDVLYNYNNFKLGIENKNGKIQDVMDHGLGRKSKSITSYGGNGSNLDAEEMKQEYIESIERSIMTTQRYIDAIDDALLQIAREKYYKILPMWYFDNQSREDIAEYFEVDVKTITRNKTQLINKLKTILFLDEAIIDAFNPIS